MALAGVQVRLIAHLTVGGRGGHAAQHVVNTESPTFSIHLELRPTWTKSQVRSPQRGLHQRGVGALGQSRSFRKTLLKLLPRSVERPDYIRPSYATVFHLQAL